MYIGFYEYCMDVIMKHCCTHSEIVEEVSEIGLFPYSKSLTVQDQEKQFKA